MQALKSSRRRDAVLRVAAGACIGLVVLASTLGVLPAGGDAATAHGGSPPRWLLCSVAVVGVIVSVLIPTPGSVLYTGAWGAVARQVCA